MDSTSSDPVNEEDTTSKQIFEYYRKYSQNRELTKYFSGTPLSYLPEIKNDDDNEQDESIECAPDIIIQTDVDIVLVENPNAGNEDEESISSPTSSVNHKLEWDSLADIGYKNDHMIKTCSNTSIPVSSATTQNSGNSPSVDPDSVSDNVKLIVFPYSSSSEDLENLKTDSIPQTSSSISVEKKATVSSVCSSPSNLQTPSSSRSTSSKRISDFKNTLSYLKKKIGIPDAHSTPYSVEKNNEEIISGKIVVEEIEKAEEQISTDLKTNMNTKTMKKGSQTVDNIVKRVINLCQTKPVTLECISTKEKFEGKTMQTENENTHAVVQTLPTLYYDLVRVSNQQNPNHYLILEKHQEADENTETAKQVSIESRSKTDVNVNRLGTSETVKKTDNESETVGDECCQTSPECVDVAEMIPSSGTENHSEYLENYINLFQKLLKSKKYDSDIKKRYLKKIISKITESKYLEESSTSSDLFFPKKSNLNDQSFLEAKQEPLISTDSTDDKSSRNISRQIRTDSKAKMSHRIKKISQIKNGAVTLEVAPNSDASGIIIHNMKENSIAVTNKESYIKDGVEKQYDLTSTLKSYDNWKDKKTISEQILEKINTQNCSGDYDKQQLQIDCIDTEINKLGMLKLLLKNQEAEVSSKKCSEMKPKTTTTYTISEKSNNSTNKKRNFVIETNLDAGPSADKCFYLDGKNYLVENSTNDNRKGRARPVLANLEVVSSNTTTNIKVRTICEACRLSPCICQTKSLEEKHLPGVYSTQEQFKKNICYKCSKLCCSCSSSRSSTCQSICLFCCTSPCSCNPIKKIQDNTSRKCLVCESDSCCCQRQSDKSVDSPVHCSKCRSSANVNRGSSKSSCSKSFRTSTITSTETVDGSLNKLFLNCKCNSDSRCNCGFVDKLLRHFRKEDLVPSKCFETRISQTETPKPEPIFNNIGVQVGAQVPNNTTNQISQTEPNIQSLSRHIGIQTWNASVENKVTETTGNAVDMVEFAIPSRKISEQTEEAPMGLHEPMTKNQKQTESINTDDNLNGTPKQNLETNSFVDTKLSPERDNSKTDDLASTNPSVSHNIETNTCSSNSSSYICISRYSKNAVPCVGRNESGKSHSSSISANERSTCNSVSPNSTPSTTCICCKKIRNIENISILHSKNQEYPVCYHCLGKKPILTSVCYAGPEKTNATSDSFRRIEEYCTCTKPSRVQNSFYCCHCQFMLKKTVKNKNAIAYTLTLENETPSKFSSRRKKRGKDLEEIKIKVPCPSNRKVFKNEENHSKKDASKKVRQSSENTKSETEKKDDEKATVHEKKIKKKLTLQEYLMTNRPDFLDSAEYRRLTVENHRTERQLNKDKLKLRFIENNSPDNETKKEPGRLFTEKEMRKITNKNYKRLPEVQQKLIESRERRLRVADRFIVDLFKKNIQGSVLKGKRTFPLNTNIVDMRA